MPAHRVAHGNEYPLEAQWPPPEVVKLGQQVQRTNVYVHHLRKYREVALRCMRADGISDGVSIYVFL